MKDPVVITLVITLPLMEPTMALLITDTFAVPPRTIPMRESARLRKNFAAPVAVRATPKNIKPIKRFPRTRVGSPMTPSGPMM